jgi:hypothetical protein
MQVGLPPASKNVEAWPIKRQYLRMAGLRANPELISETKKFMHAALRLRYSSPLFRLSSAHAILQQVQHPILPWHPFVWTAQYIILRVCALAFSFCGARKHQ